MASNGAECSLKPCSASNAKTVKVPQLPWILILVVWLYNVGWMFIQDIAKKATYRLLDYNAEHQAKFLQSTSEKLVHR
jgi:hypothetical protein